MSFIIETIYPNIRDIMCAGWFGVKELRTKDANSVSCLIFRVKALETHALTVLLGNLKMPLSFGR